MPSRAILLLAPLVLLLAACSGHKKNFAPDLSDDFVRAERQEEPPAEVRIVEVPKPLPLPGQLKKLPEENTDTTEGRMTSTSEVREKAVWSAEQGNYLNAIQVYPFVEGALYQLYASPGHVTDIALEPGEQLVSVSAGDTVRWVIGDTVSGAGEGAQVHLLIKPVQKELETNLVITTDRRSYYLDLKSFEETYMTAMRWTYPQTEIRALTRLNERSRNSAVIDKGLQLEDLDFAYSIQGMMQTGALCERLMMAGKSISNSPPQLTEVKLHLSLYWAGKMKWNWSIIECAATIILSTGCLPGRAASGH